MKFIGSPTTSTGHSWLASVVIFWLCTVATPTWAQQPLLSSPIVTKAVRFAQQGHRWYDGEHLKTAWLNPKLVAEFPPGAAQESPVSGPYPGAIVLEQPSAHIRIWRLPVGIDAVSVLNDLDSRPNQAAKYSPVFHDAPSPASRMRTLPGNIIVYFNQGWNEETISQWIQAHKLRIVRRLAIGPAAFVFQTGPGLEGLELANSLQGTDEVIAAFPDWWHETVSR
jgi:hypothetical protein